MSILSGLDNTKKYTAKIKLLNGRVVKVYSTSSYGLQCWTDYRGRSYGQIGFNNPTQIVFEVKEVVTFDSALNDAGLPISQFCELTGTPERTAMSWKSGERRTPPLAFAWLELYKITKKGGD